MSQSQDIIKEFILTSAGGNNYLISKGIPQVLLIHPVIDYLLKLARKGIVLKEWIDNLENEGIEIEDGLKTSKKEIKHYYDYLVFLKENHYFDEVKKYEMTGSRYTAEMVKFQLANTMQIIFEATSACHLKCKYCGYGDLYTGYDKRENRMLDFGIGKKLFDYMKTLLESPLNRNIHKRIAISFYGGEPLKNMSFIKRMVNYARSNKLGQKEFLFSLTSNAVELDKHIDFLAENDFHLLISLDGNKRNNGYRLFPDGSSSFEIVFNNIMELKKKYPDYFKKSVNFMAVLHNKNSNKEIRDFFQEHFGKDPLISQVNSIGIKPEKKDEFNKIFKRMYTGLEPRDLIADIKDKTRILQTPIAKQLTPFIHRYCGFVFKSYNSLLDKKENARKVSTGTCHPFERKIFITTTGKILPCERILHTYTFGKIDGNGVQLDFQHVADRYNAYYGKLTHQCNHCAASDMCSNCIFTLNLEQDKPTCNNQKREDKFNEQLKQSISLLEETPQFYPRIMRDYQSN